MHFLQGKENGFCLVCAGRIEERIKLNIFKGFGAFRGGGVQLDEDDKSLRLRDLSCDNFLLASLTA